LSHNFIINYQFCYKEEFPSINIAILIKSLPVGKFRAGIRKQQERYRRTLALDMENIGVTTGQLWDNYRAT